MSSETTGTAPGDGRHDSPGRVWIRLSQIAAGVIGMLEDWLCFPSTLQPSKRAWKDDFAAAV
jgi:hypothetical protein